MIYQFKCVECDYETELFLPVKDRNISFECKKCGGVMKRIITATQNVIYKGDGFPTSDAKKVKSWVDKNTPYPETKR